MSRRIFVLVLALALAASVLYGCNRNTTASPISTITSTPIPTNTLVPTPTPEPTQTPTVIPTVTPEPTQTPIQQLFSCDISYAMLAYPPESADGWSTKTKEEYTTWVYLGHQPATFNKANFAFVSGYADSSDRSETRSLLAYNDAPVFAQIWGDRLDLTATQGEIETIYYSSLGKIGLIRHGQVFDYNPDNCLDKTTSLPSTSTELGFNYVGYFSQIGPWEGTVQSTTFYTGGYMTLAEAKKYGGKAELFVGMSSSSHGGFEITSANDGVYLNWWHSAGSAFDPDSYIQSGIQLPYGQMVLTKTTFCNSLGCWPEEIQELVFFENEVWPLALPTPTPPTNP